MASKKSGDSGGKKRRIIANPDDPATGEYSFNFYSYTRPRVGSQRDIDRVRSQLRGLSGKEIRVTAIGQRFDADNPRNVRTTRNSTTLTMHRYGDLFGPDGALLGLFKRQVEADSSDVYVVQYIDIEELD